MMRKYSHIAGKIRIATLCFITCLGIFNRSHAQDLSGLQNSFNAYQKTNLHEKIYVHINKTAYLAGEIMWFKIYNTDGSTNEMLDLSKVAYIELLDNNHVAILQAKIAMKNGTGNGSFYLPFSLNNGNYQLRAYTNWMKNFDADYFFQQQVTIINSIKIPDVSPKQSANAYDVQFFPEGGHLVKGLNSKIAFKVTAADGKAQACTGVIIGQQNDTIVKFSSLKFGIGSFNFTPQANTSYKAFIKVGSQSITKELPSISASGYVMQAVTNNSGWSVSVQSADVQSSAPVYLIVHSRHKIGSAESTNLANGSAHFDIDKSKLDDGMSYITLFDGQKRPLCERLIFKRPAKKLVVKVSVDAQTYSTRKQVSLDIATHDQNNQPLPAKLSLSVYRLDSLQDETSNHIGGYLWLSADIKGHIQSPDYYLENNTEEANQALDNLMLSQGWTQFDWNKISTGNAPHLTFLPEYTGPVISGNIINTTDHQPAKNITAYLSTAGAHHQLYTAKSDSAGRIYFNTKNFYGQYELILQTNWEKDSTYQIDIASPFSEQYGSATLPLLKLDTNIKKILVDNSLNMQVQNVFSSKQQKQFYDPIVDSTLFYNKPDYSYLLDDYTRFPTIQEVIHEYVRFVGIPTNHGKRGLDIVNNKITQPGQPLAILDGKPIFDLDKVFLLDPLKIRKLDVITTKYIYGPAVFYGLLSFTTYNGNSTNIQLNPKAVVLDYDALQLERKFYSPVYDTQQQIDSTIPDFRNALYWNPKADTDPQGHSKLSFYTSDKPGKYIIVAEGLTPSGEAGSQQLQFEVK